MTLTLQIVVGAVPICPAGTELDKTFLWCNNCTGMTISIGGVAANGAWQPPCHECQYPSVPNLNRTECLEGGYYIINVMFV
jgi:hypothetical protein